ncbi:CsbD family protein [Hymenobacter coccineus]|uniref:CsbD family protein n=1 Tax=Hymenobacter coccineus TaxID=1908235 RepID=UPI000AD9A6E0|nr:CsbD family protein [Hymenobacter coccineus]
MTAETPKNKTGKVLLTALAGAGIGALAGVLLYSQKGIERRRNFRNLRINYRLRLRGDWDQLKGKLQQAYTQLTDEDLTYVEGKGHELVGRLQAKLGKRKRQIVKMLNAL